MGTPPPIRLVPMAPRLDTLDGKTVYFVDSRYVGGDIFLKEMMSWFSENMPKVKLEFRQKAGAYAESDPTVVGRDPAKRGCRNYGDRALKYLHAGGRRPLSRTRETRQAHCACCYEQLCGIGKRQCLQARHAGRTFHLCSAPCLRENAAGNAARYRREGSGHGKTGHAGNRGSPDQAADC